MKVCILGPVNSDKYFGGVGTFTESVADGMLEIGHEPIILTDYTNKSHTFGGSQIRSCASRPQRQSLKLVRFLKDELLKIKPDYIISSLEYGLVMKLIRNRLKSSLFINYLHGFPTTSYPMYRRLLINGALKMIGKSADCVLANSSLTSLINDEIYGIPSSGVVNLAVGYEFLKLVEERRGKVERIPRSILFAGRLSPEKGIDRILAGIAGIPETQRRDVVINIVGDGPERDRLQDLSEHLSLKADFLGFKTPREIVDCYLQNDIFISLNTHEPFGITYLEALCCGCRIVCPQTGGQRDFSDRFGHSFTYVDAASTAGVGGGILEALESPQGHDAEKNYARIVNEYNFKRVAEEILRIAHDIGFAEY